MVDTQQWVSYRIAQPQRLDGGLPWTRSSVRVQGDPPDGRHSAGWSPPDEARRIEAAALTCLTRL